MLKSTVMPRLKVLEICTDTEVGRCDCRLARVAGGQKLAV